MLVYVNNFELSGKNATERALQSVCGWIKFKTKEEFDVDTLKTSCNYKFDNITVRTFCAVALEPKMYSILLTHPDHEIKGRHWETEIGIKEEDGATKFSIQLKVNDISTQVRGTVATTRPLLVKYLSDSRLLKRDTVGLKVNFLNTPDDMRALKWEIFRPERDFPLVLVSKNKFIHNIGLQQQLLGLAQVVVFPEDTDDGLMESILTKRYSAWDGAVNIVQPLFGGEVPRNSLILSDQIESWKQNNVHVLHELLSFVTHTTNGKYRKEHFSPTDVRAKRQKDQRIALTQKVSSLTDDSDYKQLLDEAMQELDRQQEASSAEIEKLTTNLTDTESMYFDAESDKEELENNLLILRAKVEHLETHFDGKAAGLPALYLGKESDLYDGEILNILLDTLKPAYESAKQYSRRKDVLLDIIEHNQASDLKEQFFDELKKELKDYRSLTPKLREIFTMANIEVVTDGNHNKAKFVGDERYSVTFAKTASDSHAGKNNVSTIRDNLF
ncbi:hypothetical protein OMR72_003392 [Vibrio parahaemolyticus]|uniref:hypothetical protein n=1 Tax=Vibrio parahaemolyticus TaxID=670 RepID=UPI001123FA73|nr:hypothetical protein [Vibrio parahaemolyticus]EGQ8540913.1 hypothetical protein [Vibrio parahaemolyticus]EJG1014272.1 hypothetical protein [Vibrio parahaemolyticus]EKA8935132.1 hypothetical protein [Vibrio parahaemolyticus]EKF6610614.1 hypothetical protein [Vibrio parahaemolyticus]ELA9888468.1 hypothetical protein [Vibrio parahaemolyticus]